MIIILEQRGEFPIRVALTDDKFRRVVANIAQANWYRATAFGLVERSGR